MSSGLLDKMKLVGYSDNTFSNNKKTGYEYEALINPESYSISYALELNQKSAQGSSVPIVNYNKGNLQTLNFIFLFDGTGVIKKDTENIGSNLASGFAVPGVSTKVRDVVKDIANFKKVVYDYQSEKHEPPFVQLQWGALSYNCRLTKMDIKFKLFKPDGTPLRAEADCTFIGVIDEVKLSTFEGRKSPDLTHIRTVLAGDTLALLCYREYGDSKYYYQVAKYNGLTDMKQLTPGMKILFPPLITN